MGAPYTYTRDGLVRTAAGIVIGRAYQPPPAALYSEAERIQRALLLGAPRRGTAAQSHHPIANAGHRVVPLLGVAILIALAAGWAWPS
jgi:hypothetical protein